MKTPCNTLSELLSTRWRQACQTCDQLKEIRVGWAIGESRHFQQARGFAVTRVFPDGTFHLIWSEKILNEPLPRVDAITCHEIGHIADYGLPSQEWEHPMPPLHQRELRADELARFLFGVTVRYDNEDVQTFDLAGVTPRPEHLGL